jgi:putative regulator of septum formation
MRPGFSRVLLAVALLAAVSGCARVDLVNEWPSLADPTGWEPEAGVCTDEGYAETSYRTAYKPLDCTKSHAFETVYIGQFTGDAANLPRPPGSDHSAMRAAWGECDTKTTEYLGAPWRDGRIWIGVSVPSAGTWEGGARWFRCEVMASSDRFGETPHKLTASLKGTFAASGLKFGCFVRPEDEAAQWQTVDCGAQHNIEYVGSFQVTVEHDKVKDDDGLHIRCRSLIAAYAGVPDDGNMKYRVGTYVSWRNEESWEAGDNWIRCHLWTSTRMLTASVKGGGTKVLPIQYR